ncbi:hypothetical protein CHCC20335_4013 [Bacillus paralicheniformis]|nr:hypothetical protein CHCC20335_4013 [Bacillus paralicheniformis]
MKLEQFLIRTYSIQKIQKNEFVYLKNGTESCSNQITPSSERSAYTSP